MITTKSLSDETGLAQRTIQKRISDLNLKVERAGLVIVLTPQQAAQIKACNGKPGPKGKGKRK